MRALLWVCKIFPDASAGALPPVNEVSNSSYVCDRNVTLGLVSSGHCATDARRDSHANSGSIAPEHSGRWVPQFLRGPQCPVFAQPHSQPAPEIFPTLHLRRHWLRLYLYSAYFRFGIFREIGNATIVASLCYSLS